MAVCVMLATASIAEPGSARAGALAATGVSLSLADADAWPGGSDGDYEGAVLDIVQHAPDLRGVGVVQACAVTPRAPLFSRYVPPELRSNT